MSILVVQGGNFCIVIFAPGYISAVNEIPRRKYYKIEQFHNGLYILNFAMEDFMAAGRATRATAHLAPPKRADPCLPILPPPHKWKKVMLALPHSSILFFFAPSNTLSHFL